MSKRPSKITLHGKSACIHLSRGRQAWIDRHDVGLCSPYRWTWHRSRKRTYAKASIKGTVLKLHRYLLNAKKGQQIDHRDVDGLNCRRQNLRFATHAQNMCNRRRFANNTSGFTGVCFHKKNQKWVASIGAGKTLRYIGSFFTKRAAAKARDHWAKRLHEDFHFSNL